MSSTPAELWEEFRRSRKDISDDEPYQVFYFGNTSEMASELAELVRQRRKIATASLASTNELRPHEAPILGGYSVVTDFEGNAICVIRTLEITTARFADVDERFAADEGEGDLSLEWWRTAHRAYFERESAELGFSFDDDSLVCCERFVCLYPR
jgi:uncharacterized protein YhfF